MNLLFIHEAAVGGGAEYHLAKLASIAAKSKHNCTYVICNEMKQAPLDPSVRRINLDIPIIYSKFKFRKIFGILRSAKALRKFYADKKLDSVICFDPNALMISILAFGNNVTHILRFCNAINYYIDKRLKKFIIANFLLPRTDGVVFQSEYALKHFDDSIREKSIVIESMIDAKYFDTKRANQVDRKHIIMSGRIAPVKNYELAISVFAIIANKIADDLCIYGIEPPDSIGHQQELEKIATKLGVAKRVHFAGYCNNLSEKLASARLTIMTSKSEGVPASLIEALIMGIPCITTSFDGGGAEFLIYNDVDGIIVPNYDPDTFATAMLRVLTDDSLAERLSESARISSERFRPERVWAKWEMFIKKISRGI